MDLTRVIAGPVVTEKSERLKLERTYVVQVHPNATKIDVKNALKKFYDVEAVSVRVQRVRAKTRAVGAGKEIVKRHASKRMIITLAKDSKAFDVVSFKAA